MSVRRTKVDGQAALIARVSPTLWKVVYPNGKVSFFVPEPKATDWNPFQRRVPAGEHGGGQWAGENLTDREKREVTYYTTKAYRHINSTLREGLAYVLDRTVPLLDSAIAKSVIGKDYTVFRGVNSDRFIAKLEGLQPGEEITDKAYTSASGSYLAAGQYAGVGRPVMEIRIPKGSNALYAESMSVSQGMGEEEYILPRNSTFRYVGKTGSDKTTRYTFDLVRKSAKDSYDPNELRVPAGEPGGGQWRGENLTSQEKAEVGFYTGEGYATINERLRRGFPVSRTELIDSAIAKSVLTSDTVVYRGVNSSEFAGQLNVLTSGESITDAAYVSTSGSLASAATFAGGGSVMEVRLPKGSNALYTEGFSMNSGAEEDEYILPRGTTFKYVTSRTTKTGKRIHTFDLASSTARDWNPFQPRVPKGNTGGGEWTEGGSTGTGKLSFIGNKPVGLQPVHVDALKQYTANIYYPINKALRAEPQEPLSTQEQAVVKALDEAFDRAMKTTEVMQLFRAAGEEFANVVDTLKVGEDVTDHAFASTTIDENYARTLMAGQSGDRKALIEVVLPKDSRAIDTSPFNPFKGENETLLPRNTTFRYLGKERDVYRFRANPRPIAA